MKQIKFLALSSITLLISIAVIKVMAGDYSDKLKPVATCSLDKEKVSYSGDKLFTTDPLIVLSSKSVAKNHFHIVDAVAVKVADDTVFSRTKMEFKGTYTQSIYRNKIKSNEMIVLQTNGFPVNQDFESRLLLLNLSGNGSAQSVPLQCKLTSQN